MTKRARPAIAEAINPAYRTVFAAGINPWTNATMPAAPSSTAHLGSSPFTSHGYPAGEAKSAKLAAVPAPARTSAPAAAATKKKGPPPGTLCRGRVDMAALKVEKGVPLPSSRITGSYADLFAGMQPTDCVKCKPAEVVSIANALRKWIKDTKHAERLQVVSEKQNPEDPGVGRVWMWPKGDVNVLPPKSRGGVVLGRLRAKGGQ